MLACNNEYFMVTLVKSGASCNHLHKIILKKLNLKKVGRVIFIQCSNKSCCGMLKKISHLVKCNKVII